MGKRSELSVSQRVEVVLMILRKEEPIRVLARRNGVSENTLHRWKDDFVRPGESALAYGRGKGKAGFGEGEKKSFRVKIISGRNIGSFGARVGRTPISARRLTSKNDGRHLLEATAGEIPVYSRSSLESHLSMGTSILWQRRSGLGTASLKDGIRNTFIFSEMGVETRTCIGSVFNRVIGKPGFLGTPAQPERQMALH